MTNPTHSTDTADAKLLTLFEQLKVNLRAEANAPDTDATIDRAHDAVRKVEIMIGDTPAEGLVGIAIKLAIWRHINRLRTWPWTRSRVPTRTFAAS
jgi:hypothetical protein